MSGKDPDSPNRGPLRALYDWMRGGASSPSVSVSTPTPGPAAQSTPRPDRPLPSRIGHYTIARKLGEGGMGVVYAARDERLERTVALKTMSALATDDTARKRFWREARAAAAVNHPNVCQLYEIGEDAGELFIAMELLEGESLADRLRRGALSLADASPIALGMLSALSALHARGIVHRDLKPSNVFLTRHGVKLLDFGLARPDPELAESLRSEADLTRTGMLVGTPRYMAPEQVTGDAVDARTDLFAAGAILFEMLAGRAAFAGRTVVEVLHGTLYEQPPALTGSPAVAAADRLIRKALAKRPDDRPASADAMADELRSLDGASSTDMPVLARALTRIVVLPFRILRPDPETDFLAFSLPDAISTSLAAFPSLVVRSSATAARFAGEAPDLKAMASDAGVDRVVMGTLLRAGDQVRATAQLVEAPGGTLVTSHTAQSSMGDLFGMQDDIARRVVDALALPLGGTDQTPTSYMPHNPRAYELYLRANELARTYVQIQAARDHYERSLEIDATFAPAWAQLGRCHRVIGKYIVASADGETRAQEAFRRALDLNPRLSIAHKFYAQLEADMGEAQTAMVRLLGEAIRHGNDPELFSGLVHACRYCGLFDEAIAAHEEARRLDPNVPTSYEQTVLMTGDVERLLSVALPPLIAGADDGIRVIGLGLAGRLDDAREALREMRTKAPRIAAFESWLHYLEAWLDRRVPEMVERMANLDGLKIMEDPEAMFQEGWLLCDAGRHDLGIEPIERAVAKGYFPASTLARLPQFEPIRDTPHFRAILERAQAGRDRALAAFRDAGGERLLGRAT